MLAFNVAGLMGSVAGTERRYRVFGDEVDLPEDLELAAPIDGEIRLSRTSRSIIVDADLTTALRERCSRCLCPLAAPIHVTFREEALPSIDIATGLPLDLTSEPDALRIDEHHVLDVGVPVRDAVAMEEPIAPLCRPDCRGLCPECGVDLNEDPRHVHEAASVDPRMEPLASWRPPGTADPH